MANSNQCSISVASTPKRELPGASEESTPTTSLLKWFNRLPKNSRLNRIVQLVKNMQLGAEPQSVEDFPPLPSVEPSPSVVWSLFLMTWLQVLLLSWEASSSADCLGHETRMGSHVWHVQYDHILCKSPGQCQFWYVTKSTNCRPCLNFDVYTVNIRVACSLAGKGSISSWLY